MMTNEEIAAICKDWPGNALQAARAIEQAVLAKQAQSEPVAAQIRVLENSGDFSDWREIALTESYCRFREGVEIRHLYTTPPDHTALLPGYRAGTNTGEK